MRRRIWISSLLTVLLVSLFAWGNALAPLVALAPAVQRLVIDPDPTDMTAWICTAFFSTEGWVSARHCVEDEAREVYASAEYEIGGQIASLTGLSRHLARFDAPPASVVLPWPSSSWKPVIGEEVYAIAWSWDGEEDWQWFLRGEIRAIGSDGTVLAGLDTYPGNSGAPVFTRSGDQFTLVGTDEWGWRNTDGTGVIPVPVPMVWEPVVLRPPTPKIESPAPDGDDLPPQAKWQNWISLPDWLQVAWAEAWQAKAKDTPGGLHCWSGSCYWQVVIEGGLLLYVDAGAFVEFISGIRDGDWSRHTLFGADWEGQQWRR